MKKPARGSSRRRRAPQTAPDLGVSGAELEARRQQRLKTVAVLQTGRTPLQMVTVAEAAVTVADDALRDAVVRDPPRVPSACKEGCAWCCYQRVGTVAPEVLRITAYLTQTLTSEELDRTRARLDERAEQKRGRAAPCALLVENRCLAYPVRPLTCRGFNSSDARQCERSLAPAGGPGVVPSYAPQQRLCTFVLDGLRAGLEESRLDGELLELTAALRIAFTVPNAAERWLAGEPVFALARLPWGG